MGFLNPTLLWLAMGAAIPVIIHLLHRQRYKRVKWAAMEFLLAALKKTQRRMKLENLLLLLLRILVMLLLAFAIARPFFQKAPIALLGASDTHTIVVLDTSYSMGYKRAQQTSLDAAKNALEEILRRKQPSNEDWFSLVLLSEHPTVISDVRNRDGLLDAIRAVPLSSFGASLTRTLPLVEELLQRHKNVSKEIYLATDLQRIPWEPRSEEETRKFQQMLRRISNRPNLRFSIVDAGTPESDNYAVVSLRIEGRPVLTTRRSVHFAAGIYNFSAVPLGPKPVTLFVDENVVEQRDVTLEPNALTTVRFKVDFLEAGPHKVRVRIEPDFLPLDDLRYLSVDVRKNISGLLIDGDPGPRMESETYFYRTALDPLGSGRDFQLQEITPELFTGEDLEGFDFVVLANVASLSEEKIGRLEQFVQNGGGLFLALGDRVDRLSLNEQLWKNGQGLLPARLGELAGDPEGRNPRRFSSIRRDHPVFHTLGTVKSAAVYDLLFHRYFQIEEAAEDRVLARFDDNFRTPVLLEKSLGEGRVLMLTTPIDDEWSEGWPGYPPYLVLMRDLTEHLASRPASRLNVQVGEPIRIVLPMKVHAPDFELLTPPPGGSITVLPTALEHTDKWFRLEYSDLLGRLEGSNGREEGGLIYSGFYSLMRKQSGETDPVLAHFACNLSPAGTSTEEIQLCEGRLDRISPDEIRQRYPEFTVEFLGSKSSEAVLAASALPASNLWKWILYLLLIVMGTESFLAWFFGRSKQ